MYGFLRVTTSGTDFGSYYHELFLHGRWNLCRYMKRVGAPRALDRRTFKLAEGEDPNFYKMEPLDDKKDSASKKKAGKKGKKDKAGKRPADEPEQKQPSKKKSKKRQQDQQNPSEDDEA